jgi:hypothetical protein
VKLYLPGSSVATATLNSLWSVAGGPTIIDNLPTVAHTEQLVDNKPLPFFPLSAYEDPGGPDSDALVPSGVYRREHIYGVAGSTSNPDLSKIDKFYFQLFTCGAPIKASGGSATIAWDWVVNDGTFACGLAWERTGVIQMTRFYMYIPFVYIYRPSTGAVVGNLAYPASGKLSTIFSDSGYFVPNNSGDSPGFVNTWRTLQMTNVFKATNYTLANVAGVQDGDYIVYEIWGGCTGQRNNAGAFGLEIRLFVGQGDVLKWEIPPRMASGMTAWDQGYGANADDRAYSKNSPPPSVTFFYLNDLVVPSGGASIGFPNVGAPVTLTDVSPGTGPRLSLTFDNPIGITGPTLGPASSGVAATGATQVDETHIDLDLAIAPTEVLTGEAQACNAFAAPTGGTATDTGGGV